MAEIFISNGDTSEIVETETNTPGVMTPIARIVPDRGTFLRLLNMVAKGSEQGVPIYAKLRDSNGDLLAVSTKLQFEISPAGTDERMKVSKRVEQISVYNSYSLQEQRNVDNVDATKVVLTSPENMGGDPVANIEWADIQDLFVSARAPAEVDWSQSEFYVDSTAVEGPFNRGR
jgi:hypothetical protein